MEKFQDALEGKITTEGWTAEELVEYHKFLRETTDKEKSEVSGFREAKRAESDRVEKLKAEALAIEEANKKAGEGGGTQETTPSDPKFNQFREEQVQKAKTRLFDSVSLTDEEKAAVNEKFERLDTGKIDADLIYLDLVSSVAAANPNKFLELTQDQETRERNAIEELEKQAAGGGAPPSEEEKKKYNQETLDLAKKAGITPEEALRQTTQGMTRTYE